MKGGGQSTSHELRGVPPDFPLSEGAPAQLEPLLLFEVEGILSSPVLDKDDTRRILAGFIAESRSRAQHWRGLVTSVHPPLPSSSRLGPEYGVEMLLGFAGVSS